MDLNPPAGSKISILRDGADPTIAIPAASSPMRYLMGLFLLCWLGGWTFGFWSAVSQLLSGRGGAFLIFWLGGWTVAGIFAALTLYRIFRSPVPETLQLQRNRVTYDSGIPPFQFESWRSRNPRNAWSFVFPKRVRIDLDRRQLQSLRLRETEAGNRLTIDVDAQRVEMASGASEVEREWLARLLASRYALEPVGTGASAGQDLPDRR